MNIGLVIYELMVSGFYGALMLAAAVLPGLAVWRVERLRRQDPAYLLRVGVVVRTSAALDGVTEEVGRYMNVAIYEQVMFKGIAYRYDRVAPSAYKGLLQPAELFMEPGIVYVAQPPSPRR
jgi:hypothetical protein